MLLPANNSDAMAYAYVNGALDAAILAIDDLMD